MPWADRCRPASSDEGIAVVSRAVARDSRTRRLVSVALTGLSSGCLAAAESLPKPLTRRWRSWRPISSLGDSFLKLPESLLRWFLR
jgi:hypothetical protein